MAADSPGRGDPRESGGAAGVVSSALHRLRWPLLVALLAVIYFWAAKLGLSMGVTPRVTAVWPPTGIALAALLLFGYRLWPGIILGAFLANVTAPQETVGTAAGIAVGNTLEALLGAWLLKRWADFDCSLGRLRDVLGLILLAAGLSTTISASIGVASLWLGGIEDWSVIGSHWWAWWVGDATGALIVAPVLLVLATTRGIQSVCRLAELAGLLVGLVATGLFVFGGQISPKTGDYSYPYAIFPFIIWAALRFGQPGTTVATLAASSLAIWGTLGGTGPFGIGAIHERLLSLQLFMAVVAVTALLLSAALTERRRASEELRQQREWLHVTLRSIDGAVIATDARGHVTFLNPLAEILTGWNQEALGRPLPVVFHLLDEATRKQEQGPVSSVLESGSSIRQNKAIVLLAKDGREVAIDSSAAPIRDADGKMLGVVQVFRDISRRRRDEQRIAALHAVTRALVESTTLAEAAPLVLQSICTSLRWQFGALWQVHADGAELRCVEVWQERPPRFPEFERTTRALSFASGIGLPGRVWASNQPCWIADAVHDPNCPRAEVARQEGLHGAFGFPVRMGTEVLGVIEFFSSDICQPDDGLLRMLGTIGSQIGQFIERKQVEQAVRESEERFRTTFTHAAVGMVLTDLQGRFLHVNPAFSAITGYAEPELYERTFYDITPVEDQSGKKDLVQQVLDGVIPSFMIEKRYLTKQGGEVRVQNSVSLIRDRRGKPKHLVVLVEDITHRKRLEQELKRRVQEMAEADRRKDEFLALLAHELRNPLAPIRNGVEVMRVVGLSDPQLRDVRDMMERQVNHISRLVDDLLDVSRVTRGKVRCQKEPTELAAVVAHAVETCRPIIAQRRQELILSPPKEPLRLEADPVRLAQVFANLLNNAAKYSKENSRITLTASREGDQAVVRVRDEGIGIAPEMLPRIFDLFAQADVSLGRSDGGLGIGLTLVRSLVTLHGGVVQAFSEGLGKGAEFVVKLPLLTNAVAPRADKSPTAIAGAVSKPSREANRDGGRRRILVVDDNRDAAKSLEMLLKFMGYDIHVALDGADALAKAQAFHPDVVLLDIGLPGMDGFEVARRLRQELGMREALLVAMTGYGQEEDRRHSQEAGFNAHLVKPVDLAALRSLLSEPRDVQCLRPVDSR
jgi:PAS domain S-box-containing protein